MHIRTAHTPCKCSMGGTDLGTGFNITQINANPRGLEFEGKAQLFCIVLVAGY